MVANNGLPSIADALESAYSSQEGASSADTEAQPAEEVQEETAVEHAEGIVEEHPESEEVSSAVQPEQAEDESLFGDLDDEVEGSDEPLAVTDETLVDLPDGSGQLPIGELKKGYLRQADYTKKRQQDVAEREAWEARNEEAIRLHEAAMSDPVRLFAALAQQVGVEVDLKGVNPADFKLPSKAEIEAEIERRAQELVENDPTVVKARANDAIQIVEDEFARLEHDRGVKLGEKDRVKIMEESMRANAAPFDVIYDALLARRERVRASREGLRQASTPEGRAGQEVTTETKPNKKLSVAEAMEWALAHPDNDS